MGSEMWIRDRPSVGFPEPLSPTKPTDSPFFMVKSTPLTPLLKLTILLKKPFRLGKYFLRPLTSKIFSLSVSIIPPHHYIYSNLPDVHQDQKILELSFCRYPSQLRILAQSCILLVAYRDLGQNLL